MSAYGFMPKFVAACLAGTKPHTIRAVRKDGRKPRVGEPFYAYTGMRQPVCTWLFTSEIVKVEAIQIGPDAFDFGLMPFVRIDDEKLDFTDMEDLALADGFSCTMEFRNHFLPSFLTSPGPFIGYLIHWRPEDAQATRHHCPECGSRVRWSEICRGFPCLCGESAAERIHRFKRPTKPNPKTP